MTSQQIEVLHKGDIIVWKDWAVHSGGFFPQGHYGRFSYVFTSNIKLRKNMNEWLTEEFRGTLDTDILDYLQTVESDELMSYPEPGSQTLRIPDENKQNTHRMCLKKRKK